MSAAPEEHVQRMYRYASALVRMQESGYLTRKKLSSSHHLQMETAMHFQVVGEAAAALERLGYDLGGSIPIGDIAGLRNRVSHDYEGINWNILEDILFEDIPMLVSDLTKVMNERGIACDEIPLPEDSQEAHPPQGAIS